MTTAEKAGISDHKWTLEEVVEMMDEYQAERERLAFEEAFSLKL